MIGNATYITHMLAQFVDGASRVNLLHDLRGVFSNIWAFFFPGCGIIPRIDFVFRFH